MKAGDLVHVPADVTLIRNTSHRDGLLGVRHYKTKVPKKAMFVEDLDSNPSTCYIEYGEHTWVVDRRDIKLVEYNNDR